MIRRRRSIQSRFGNRWFQSFNSGIPWIDAIIIVVLLLVVNNRLTIVPGMVFDLPSAPLRGGSAHNALTAVMVPVAQNISNGRETMVFFDDERFSMRDEHLLARLSEKVRYRIQASSNRDMLLLADKNVPHGDVMRFINIVREAGVQQVNVGEKPE